MVLDVFHIFLRKKKEEKDLIALRLTNHLKRNNYISFVAQTKIRFTPVDVGFHYNLF